jgi:di/tricarboxylate transporter
VGLEAWITLGVVLLVIGLMAFTRIAPDLIMCGGLGVLLVSDVIGPAEALNGFSNPAVITIAALYAVVMGVRNTGGLDWLAPKVLGRPRSLAAAQSRVMFLASIMSAFLNNTPVVAMFIPAIAAWARKHKYSVSKLLIPLSYAAILGGTCTLIGTSTNLVVNGLLIDELIDEGFTGLEMFEVAWIGLPLAVLGTGYLLLVSRKLLPDRRPVISRTDDPREYTVEMIVEGGSPLVSKTIEQAGLRHLPGMYLMAIERAGEAMVAVGPQERLLADDRLVFVGVVESVVDLQRIHGLRPATDQVFKLDSARGNRVLIEAVVSNSCPLIRKTIREGKFRSHYNAVVVAAARQGQRIQQKIGDIELRPGDTLLLEAHPSFAKHMRDSRDFYLVSSVKDSTPRRREKAWIAMAILVGMVLVVTLGWLSMLKASMLAVGLMILTRCLRGDEARASVDWQVLLVIVAAFGLGHAMQASKLAETLANGLVSMIGNSPWIALAVLGGIASFLNGVITSKGAAVLIFPIAVSMAREMGVSIMPFAVTIMVNSTASFATPLGYQTNLMVYGPGGYRFADYLRLGLPLHVMAWGCSVLIAPAVWPF